ncbi:MAG: hypothetical protein ACRENZ_10720 [Thermodesulfobacteriota bacterium]
MQATQYIGGFVGVIILFLMQFLLFMIPHRIALGKDQIPLGELLHALGLDFILIFASTRKRWP